jgi:hypothetical protein
MQIVCFQPDKRKSSYSVHTAKSLPIKRQTKRKACKSSILQAFRFLPVPYLRQEKGKHPENYTPSDFRHNPGSN